MAIRMESFCLTAMRKVNRPVSGGKEEFHAVDWSCNSKYRNKITSFDLWFGCDVYQLLKFLNVLIFLLHRLRVHATPDADLQNYRRSSRFLRLSGTHAWKCHSTIHTGQTVLWIFFPNNLFMINKQIFLLLRSAYVVKGGGDRNQNRYQQRILVYTWNIRMFWNKNFKM